MAELEYESNRVFARRLRNGMVIERRRRDMPDGGSVLTHTDITELTEREGEIARQHGLMAGTLANVDQGMLVLDADLRLVLWIVRLIELPTCRPILPVGVQVQDMVAVPATAGSA